MNHEIYKRKYLKYKNKYNNLSKQIGGLQSMYKKIFTSNQPTNTYANLYPSDQMPNNTNIQFQMQPNQSLSQTQLPSSTQMQPILSTISPSISVPPQTVSTTTVPPQTVSTTVPPPTVSTTVPPPTVSTTVPPPTVSTTVPPPTVSTTVPPPTVSTATPQTISTSITQNTNDYNLKISKFRELLFNYNYVTNDNKKPIKTPGLYETIVNIIVNYIKDPYFDQELMFRFLNIKYKEVIKEYNINYNLIAKKAFVLDPNIAADINFLNFILSNNVINDNISYFIDLSFKYMQKNKINLHSQEIVSFLANFLNKGGKLSTFSTNSEVISIICSIPNINLSNEDAVYCKEEYTILRYIKENSANFPYYYDQSNNLYIINYGDLYLFTYMNQDDIEKPYEIYKKEHVWKKIYTSATIQPTLIT